MAILELGASVSVLTTVCLKAIPRNHNGSCSHRSEQNCIKSFEQAGSRDHHGNVEADSNMSAFIVYTTLQAGIPPLMGSTSLSLTIEGHSGAHKLRAVPQEVRDPASDATSALRLPEDSTTISPASSPIKPQTSDHRQHRR